MLYPTLNELTKKVGNRYLLVNEVAHRARKIAQKAYDRNESLPEKPVKMAIMELATEEDKSENIDEAAVLEKE